MSQINPQYVDGLELRIKELSEQLTALRAEVIDLKNAVEAEKRGKDELREQLKEAEELHVTQLAGVSTAAFANTRETHAQSIGRENPYWTQAYKDVVDAIGREIELREQLTALREQLEDCKAALRELDLTGIQYQEKPVDAVGRMRGIAMAALAKEERK